MSMLDSVKAFIAEHPEHKEIIIKTIIRFQEIQHEWYTKRCSICDKELTETEIHSIDPRDFSHTCFLHRDHAKVFQVDLIRQKLGIPSRELVSTKLLNSLL